MKIPLTISLLASNRISSLERCLDSLKPLLQKVPAELIVVFTGTDERVRQVAARYTDQIIPFTWCDDFSAARNEGLKRAKGEWFLYLDDDEWFEDVTEICDFFQSGEYKKYQSASYIVRNYLDWNGQNYTDFPTLRMIKRTQGVTFKNPIHEELTPLTAPCKIFEAYVHHYGYLKDTCKQDWKKCSRNISLLLKDIEEQPHYIKNYLQLTKEYCVEKKWNEAETFCRQGRSLCRGAEDVDYQRWFQVYLINILYQEKEYQRAEAEALEILEKEQPSELVRLNLYLFLIFLCDIRKAYTEALHFGDEFEKLLIYMDENQELWIQQMYGELNRNRLMEPERLYPARLNCVKAALELQDFRQAEYFLNLLPWEKEHQIQQYYPLLDQWKETYPSILPELFDELPYDSSYLLLQKLFTESQKAEEDSGNLFLFHRCLKEIEQPYLQKQLVEKALRENRDLSVLLKRIDLDSWRSYISEIVNETPYDENRYLWEAMGVLLAEYPMQGMWLKKLLLEKELSRGFLMKEQFLLVFEEYARSIRDFYQEQYQCMMFEEDSRYLLPADCRMALTALKALDNWKRGKLAETVRMFRRTLQIDPRITGVVREALRLLKNEADYPAPRAGAEFEQLAIQMKAALKTMIGSGQYKEAMSVLAQLLPLLPEDMELLKMQQALLAALAD